jgi:hypothetical protein
MSALFTIRIEDEAGNVVCETVASFARDAAAALKAAIIGGAYYGEVINNHYKIVQFRANRSSYVAIN